MALSFRRAVSNYHSIIAFDRRLQQKRTCSDILLQRTLRSLLDSHPLWKASISEFLIWFSVLESPPLGQSPGTQSSSWSRSLRSCLHYTAALSVLRPKPPWTDKVPALIYYVLLTFHGLSYQLYFSVSSWNVFNSRCYQLVCLGGFY